MPAFTISQDENGSTIVAFNSPATLPSGQRILTITFAPAAEGVSLDVPAINQAVSGLNLT